MTEHITYKVKPGESFASIAGRVYGDQRMFAEIIRANPGAGVLQPGQVIRLPSKVTDPYVSPGQIGAARSGQYGGPSQPTRKIPEYQGYSPSFQQPSISESVRDFFYAPGGSAMQYGGDATGRHEQGGTRTIGQPGTIRRPSQEMTFGTSDPVQGIAQQGQAFGLPRESLDPNIPYENTMRGKFDAFMGAPLPFGGKVANAFSASMLALPGAVAGAAVAGLPGALALSSLGAWAGWQSAREDFDQNSITGKVLRGLDFPFQTFEKVLGLVGQTAGAIMGGNEFEVTPGQGIKVVETNKDYGTLADIYGSPEKFGAAWEAGGLLYESMPIDVRLFSNPKTYFDLSKWARGEFAAPIQSNDRVFVDYDLPTTTGGVMALVEARKRIAAGEDAALVKAQMAARFGAPGQIRELAAGFSRLDPIDTLAESIPGVARVTAGVADRAGVPGAADVARAAAVSGGTTSLVQAYRNILLTKFVPEYRTGFVAGRDMNWLQQLIIGKEFLRVAESGTYDPPKWWELWRLTPESQAKESVIQFGNHVQAYLSDAIPLDDNYPKATTEFITKLKQADLDIDSMPREWQEPAKLSVSIEGRVVQRALDDTVAHDLYQAWQATEFDRTLFHTIADSLGVPVETIFTRIKAGEGDVVWKSFTKLSNELRFDLSRFLGGRKVDNAYLTEHAALFSGDGVPYNLEMYRAALMSGLTEAAGHWAVQTFGIKAPGFINKLAAAVKGVESIALLGLNISYPIKNFLNGEITMAARGVWGLRSIKAVMADMDRMGVSPGRIYSGLGAADIGDDLGALSNMAAWGIKAAQSGNEPIRRAMSSESGILGEIARKAGEITGKLPPTAAAQKIERWQSVRAFAEGMRQMWGQVWRRGVGYNRMSRSLESSLAAIDPLLPEYIYAAVESGMNPKEIAGRIFDTPVRRPILQQFVDRVAAQAGMSPEDVTRLLSTDGIADYINRELAKVGDKATAGDVANIFRLVRDRVEKSLDDMVAQEFEVRAEAAAAQVQVEGAEGLFEVMDDIELKLYDTYNRHMHALAVEWESVRRNKRYRNVVLEAMRQRADSTWQRYFAFEEAAYQGMVDGMRAAGLQVDDAFMPALKARRTTIADFHALKNKIIDAVISATHDTPEARSKAWQEAMDKIDAAYRLLMTKQDKWQRAIDKYLVAMSMQKGSKEYAAAVKQWRDTIRQFNLDDMEAVAKFRRDIANKPPDSRDGAWIEFNNNRLMRRYDIARQAIQLRREIFGGGDAKMPDFTPLVGDLKPGLWWQQLADRYDLNYKRKDGRPHYKHFENAVNKYIDERFFGEKVKLNKAEYEGLPSPDRLHEIVKALENRATIKRAAARAKLGGDGAPPPSDVPPVSPDDLPPSDLPPGSPAATPPIAGSSADTPAPTNLITSLDEATPEADTPDADKPLPPIIPDSDTGLYADTEAKLIAGESVPDNVLSQFPQLANEYLPPEQRPPIAHGTLVLVQMGDKRVPGLVVQVWGDKIWVDIAGQIKTIPVADVSPHRFMSGDYVKVMADDDTVLTKGRIIGYEERGDSVMVKVMEDEAGVSFHSLTSLLPADHIHLTPDEAKVVDDVREWAHVEKESQPLNEMTWASLAASMKPPDKPIYAMTVEERFDLETQYLLAAGDATGLKQTVRLSYSRALSIANDHRRRVNDAVESGLLTENQIILYSDPMAIADKYSTTSTEGSPPGLKLYADYIDPIPDPIRTQVPSPPVETPGDRVLTVVPTRMMDGNIIENAYDVIDLESGTLLLQGIPSMLQARQAALDIREGKGAVLAWQDENLIAQANSIKGDSWRNPYKVNDRVVLPATWGLAAEQVATVIATRDNLVIVDVGGKQEVWRGPDVRLYEATRTAAFGVDDSVMTVRGGKVLTGKILTIDSDGTATVDVDQIAYAGGVPIGRTERWKLDELSRIGDTITAIGAEGVENVKPGIQTDKLGNDDPGSLAGASPENVPGVGETGQVDSVGVRSAGTDTRDVDSVAGSGIELPGSVGVDQGGVGIATDRGGQATPDTRPIIEAAASPAVRRVGQDYVITDADTIGAGGAKTKFKDNVNAINTLRRIESEGRLATPEEQAILVKYVGWGGLSQVFDHFRNRNQGEWSDAYKLLRELLTTDEWNGAAASTGNAHYTHPDIIRAMWQTLERMGFEGGKVLEPAVGIGHFFGLMPANLVSRSVRVGVEMDSLTARIAKQLYQSANILHSPYQDATLPKGYFDLAISNVPFGKISVYDPAFKGKRFITGVVHNYFFAKALDHVRPGGVVAFITSRYTLDAKDSRLRRYLAERAEFLGAIRLPNTTFKGNALTEVTTDVIFLHKRVLPIDVAEGDLAQGWINLGEVEVDDAGLLGNINEYFVAHPEMMLGKMREEGSMYSGKELTLVPDTTRPLREAFMAAAAALPNVGWGKAEAIAGAAQDIFSNQPKGVKDGSLLVDSSGQVKRRIGDRVENVEAGAKEAGVVAGYSAVRDSLTDVMNTMLSDATDDDVAKAQVKLNAAYDAFVKEHGALHDKKNQSVLHGDPDLPRLLALEKWNPRTKTARKADIFSSRTIRKPVAPDITDSAKDALLITLEKHGVIDWREITRLTGRNEASLQAELEGLVFKSPDGNWYTADEYLSGNVRQKLRDAEGAAALDSSYQANVEALKLVMPKDVPYSQIGVRLGQSWIPEDIVSEFIEHIVDARVGVKYIEQTGKWIVGKPNAWAKRSTGNTFTWSAAGKSAMALIADSLDMKNTTVWDRSGDRPVVDVIRTEAARQMQRKIEDEFVRWLWSDETRTQTLAALYNEARNFYVPRRYDGSHLSLPGTAIEFHKGGEYEMRQHQLNAIWRVMQGNNTLIGHEVGAGKTFVMVAAGMELKRLGKISKPMYIVPNHMLAQWTGDIYKMYPAAKVLVASKDDLVKGRREILMSRIATGDWDAVVITHSSFSRLPVRDDTWNSFIQQQIGQLEEMLWDAKEGGADRVTVKTIEAQKENLKTKLRERQEGLHQDDTITFEELGVDQLFVDEAHEFKNLYFPTRLGNAPGISTTGSNRAYDLFVKTMYLNGLRKGKGVVLATGTPISNSFAEMFTLQRYLQWDTLESMGLVYFDAWVAQFAQKVTEVEYTAKGGYKPTTKFMFWNVPELVNMFHQFADIKLIEDLGLPRPLLETGKPIPVAVPATDELKAFQKVIAARAEQLPNVPKWKDNILKLSTEGRMAALDMRLIDPNLPDNPNSKINVAVDRIFKIWQDTAENRLTQIVFIDFSSPTSKRFSVYQDMRNKLIARGVPADEIAFIHDAKKDAQKQELFDNVNEGRVRILMGSTKRMGAGTNVQKRVIALHHLDTPWRPSDIEQRDGRGWRQGNINEKLAIYRYLTQESFDVFMWQKIESKAKNIAAVMTNKTPDRRVEDTGKVLASVAEMKAVATGNPYLIEQARLEMDLRRLRLLQAAHVERLSVMAYDRNVLPKRVGALEDEVTRLRAALEIYQANKTEKFVVSLEGKTYSSRQEAGAVITAWLVARLNSNVSHKIGTLYGADIVLKTNNTTTPMATLTIGDATLNVSLGMSPEGNIARLENALRDLPDRIKAISLEITNLTTKLKQINEQIDRPFDHAEELAQIQDRKQIVDEEVAKFIAESSSSQKDKLVVDDGDNTGRIDDLLSDVMEDDELADMQSDTPDDDETGGGYGVVFDTPMGKMNYVGNDAQGNYLVVDRYGITHVVPQQGDANFAFLNSEAAESLGLSRPVPHAEATEEAYYNKLLPVLNLLQAHVEGVINTPSIKGVGSGKDGAGRAPMDQYTRAMLDDYLKETYGKMAESKLLSMKWGEFKRDAALLNYSRRYQFNNLAGAIMPYEFFMTGSFMKWMLHSLDRPSLLANYYRVQRLLNTAVGKPGFPARLAGRVRIPMPFLPQWMGGGMWVDPMNGMLPLESFARPWQQLFDNTGRVENATGRVLRDMLANGEISQSQYDEAMQQQAGALYDRAKQLAIQKDENLIYDATDFASTMAGPHLPLQWAVQAARGTTERIQPLPITRQLRALTAALGIGGSGGVNIEAGIRRRLGLPVFDQWEDYRIDRELANMAGEGLITSNQAVAAMIERTGYAYDVAVQRSAQAGGYGTIGGMIFGTTAGVYPEGEQRQRLLSQLYSAAREAQNNGDTEALAKFFDTYPEYESRLALYSDPESRIRNFLVDQIWTAWYAMPDLWKRQLRQQLGAEFEDAFINKDTRNYDSIAPDVLASWARAMGRYVPLNVDGAPAMLHLAPPQIAAQAQEYYDTRRSMFGDRVYDLQSAYYLLPKEGRVTVAPQAVLFYLNEPDRLFGETGALWDEYHSLPKGTGARKAFLDAHPQMIASLEWKKQYLAEHPEVKAYLDSDAPITKSVRSQFLAEHPLLAEYWNWRRAWLDAHPDAAPYITEKASESETETPTARQIIGSPEMQRVVIAYLFSGTSLPRTVRQELTEAWQSQGAPGTFDAWLLNVVSNGGSLLPMPGDTFNHPVAMP